MSIILRLQNLPWTANSLDIRRYFQSLSIPEGGVHIVGGDKGDAFIAFSTDEDARQAMERDGGKVKDSKIKLMLSSRMEMQKVIEQARSQCAPPQPIAPPPTPKAKDKDRSRTPDRSRKSSPEKRRDKEKSPRDRDRDKSRRSSRKDKSRSRSPRRNRDKDRDRDSDRRSKREDRRKSDDAQKSKDESSRHDNNLENRSTVSTLMPVGLMPAGNGNANGALRQTSTPFIQSTQLAPIEPWIDTVWGDGRRSVIGGVTPTPEIFRSNVQPDFLGRSDSFGRSGDSVNALNAVNSFSRSEGDGERSRFGLPPAFEGIGAQRRQGSFSDNGIAFQKPSSEDTIIKSSFRAFDSDQRIPPKFPPLVGGKPMQGFEDQGFPPNPARGFGFCIEVKGLPYSVSYKDVRDLFRGIYITTDGLKLINDETGKRTGTAIIRLTNQRDVNEALKRNRQYVGDSYIDVFRCTDNIFDQAVDSYLPPGMKKPSVHLPPMPNDLVVALKGLPYSCQEEDIIHFFDGLRILDVHIEHGFNGRATGCGYVEFGTPVDFHAAMSMNGGNIGHRYIELSVSSKDMMAASRSDRTSLENSVNLPPTERDRPPVTKELLPLPQQENRPSFCVAIQGLPFNVTDRDIADFFSDVGVPLAIHIMLNQDRLPTGEAFVEFTTLPQFEMAVNRSGQFIGPNVIKVLSIPYEEMMELLGAPVGRNEGRLNRPLNDSRSKGILEDRDITHRPLINNNRVRSGIKEIEESNSSRLGIGELRSFPGGGMRDPLAQRTFPIDSQDGMSMRNFPDGPGYRNLQDHRDGLPPSRGFQEENRNFSGRPLMDGLDRPKGFLDDSRERTVRHGGRPEFEGFDDLGRNRRLPEDISSKGRIESPDTRGRGPMDRVSDLKISGRHILDTPQTRGHESMHDSRGPSDFLPGPEGRLHRGPQHQSSPGPNDRRRVMPAGGGPSPNSAAPEGFGKPGCVIGAANIPYRANVDEILAIFKDYSLTKDNIIRRFDNLGRVTGDARLAFHKPEDAKKALAELNGKSINGRPISLFIV